MDTRLNNTVLENIKYKIIQAQEVIEENQRHKKSATSLIDNIYPKLKNKINFVLQGGAGSGKTETLKQVIEYISEKYPEKKILCITHTNNAVAELKSRVQNANKFEISTIHSFLNKLIKHYKKNIKKNIFQLFILKNVEDKAEYKIYQKVYESYLKLLFKIENESFTKCPSKKEFDDNSSHYITLLNNSIDMLNLKIKTQIEEREKEKAKCTYNETRFDQWNNLTFGHDSLLEISSILIKKYPLLKKIICDSYDFILIDEYQDTNKNIMDVFIEIASSPETNIVLGLFGDSMQGIYEDGIGDVDMYIENGKLIKIEKGDNFRCSHQVVEFINIIRNDEIKQKVALKKGEKLLDRQGSACLYYKYLNHKKPHNRSSLEEKSNYLDNLNKLISEVKSDDDKILMLTNNSIAKELGFQNLYKIFNDRFIEVKDEIEKELATLQLIDLLELCDFYLKKKYAQIYYSLKKTDFSLKSVQDKKRIKELFDKITSSEISVNQALSLAFKERILIKSESYQFYIDRMNSFKKDLDLNLEFKSFKESYNSGLNTVKKLNDITALALTKEKFNELEKLVKQEKYYIALFAEELKFIELINYYKYIQDETQYITMHKTKGSGIENVLIVLDEYFWNDYNFRSIYDNKKPNQNTRLKSQKLFYVSCSRAIKNLKIVRLIEDENEKVSLEQYFPSNTTKECGM